MSFKPGDIAVLLHPPLYVIVSDVVIFVLITEQIAEGVYFIERLGHPTDAWSAQNMELLPALMSFVGPLAGREA